MKKLIYILSIVALVNVSHAQLMGGEGAPALQKGDIIVGGKLALGSVYNTNVGFIAGAEYGLMEGFLAPPKFNTSLGIGANLAFSSGHVAILGAGYWHINLIKKEQFDTYVVITAGIDVGNSLLPTGDAGVGIRYYFIPKLSAVAEARSGSGFLRVGLDFKI